MKRNQHISIVLANSQRLVRQGLKALLSARPDFRVIGEGGNGLEIIATVKDRQPDILILDQALPRLSGLDVSRYVHERWPKIGVVLISRHGSEDAVQEALTNGVSAYVLKDSTAVELVKAVREAAAGRRYLVSPLSRRSLRAGKRTYLPKSGDSYRRLTPREAEVFRFAAEGHTNNEIAARLFISRRTVESHRASLKTKLKLRSTTDLVRYALRQGILPDE